MFSFFQLRKMPRQIAMSVGHWLTIVEGPSLLCAVLPLGRCVLGAIRKQQAEQASKQHTSVVLASVHAPTSLHGGCKIKPALPCLSWFLQQQKGKPGEQCLLFLRGESYLLELCQVGRTSQHAWVFT